MEKILPDLEIPEALFGRLVDHARQEYPLESCGILAGEKGKITRVYSVENIEKSPFSYLMAPGEQLKVLREIEEDGLELSALYHSHPHSPAFPSQRDVDYAFYPESLILIISLMDRKVPEICAFQIKDGKIKERGIKVKGKNWADLNHSSSFKKNCHSLLAAKESLIPALPTSANPTVVLLARTSPQERKRRINRWPALGPIDSLFPI